MSGSDTDIYSRDLELSELLDGIENGDIALPNFQRDFDWFESDVISLIATVLSGWPAGSLLIMTGEPGIFELRAFEGAPPLTQVRQIVLDGQQRLTSLYHAFRGAGPSVYALRIDAVLSDDLDADAIEEALIVVPRADWESSESYSHRLGRELVPLSVLASAADYYEWRDVLVHSMPVGERDEVAGRLATVYKRVLSKANTYKFPSVLLGSGLQPAAVARIFERINKTGMRLSTFDLLVARSYTSSWNLRDAWIAARDENPWINAFLGDDGLPIAQVIALRASGDVRQPALLKLSGERIQSDWDDAANAMDRACGFLARLGCRSGAWLPYRAQLLPLAALAMDVDLESARNELEAWFWASSFGMTYEVGSSTVAAADFRILRGQLAQGGSRTYTLSRPAVLRATRKKQGALWRAFMCALSWHQALDPVSGAPLAGRSPDELVAIPAVPKQTDSSGGGHTLVLAQVLAEKSSARRLRQSPWAASFDTADPNALDSQFVPAGRHDFVNDATGFASARLDKLEDALSEQYTGGMDSGYRGAIRFVDSLEQPAAGS